MSARVVNAFDLMRQTIAQSRPVLNNLDSNLFPDTNYLEKSLIEISGRENSGKTRVLQYLIGHCVVSNCFEKKENCSSADVLFIDLQHKFDSTSFLKQIQTLLLAAGIEEMHAHVISLQSLKHIIYVNYYTAEELECGLSSCVEEILMENEKIALLAVDGLDAFYWLDSYKKLSRMSTYLNNYLTQLRKICDNNNICCAYTVDSNFLEAKHSKNCGQIKSQADFRLQLSEVNEGVKKLNGKDIDIDINGLHFIN